MDRAIYKPAFGRFEHRQATLRGRHGRAKLAPTHREAISYALYPKVFSGLAGVIEAFGACGGSQDDLL